MQSLPFGRNAVDEVRMTDSNDPCPLTSLAFGHATLHRVVLRVLLDKPYLEWALTHRRR